jgi:Molybdate transporter of MFS superfamily
MVDAPATIDPGTEMAASRRSWFAWNLDEVSGALGDLGTFLPHIIGAVTVVGMDPTGILMTFGLFYAFSGAFYGIPMAVQPMKAASAAVLIQPMDPGAVAGAGLVIGGFFLAVGASSGCPRSPLEPDRRLSTQGV